MSAPTITLGNQKSAFPTRSHNLLEDLTCGLISSSRRLIFHSVARLNRGTANWPLFSAALDAISCSRFTKIFRRALTLAYLTTRAAQPAPEVGTLLLSTAAIRYLSDFYENKKLHLLFATLAVFVYFVLLFLRLN